MKALIAIAILGITAGCTIDDGGNPERCYNAQLTALSDQGIPWWIDVDANGTVIETTWVYENDSHQFNLFDDGTCTYTYLTTGGGYD